MTDRTLILAGGVGLVLVLVLVHRANASAPAPQGTATIGPVVPVTGPGSGESPTDPEYNGSTLGTDTGPSITDQVFGDATSGDASGLQDLCGNAPLKSFGPACQGITWDYNIEGAPYDFRDPNGGGAFGFDIIPDLVTA